MISVTREQQLHELVQDLFDAEGLRRWLAFGPEGTTVVHQLPGGHAPLATLAFEAISVMRRRGLLDQEFFARLLADFPHRRRDIEAVAARF